MNKILYWASCLAVCTACNDFLDEMPDNRTSLDSEKNIASLLVTAYPDQTNAMIGEMLSDNVDENKRTYSFWAKVQEEREKLETYKQMMEQVQERLEGLQAKRS